MAWTTSGARTTLTRICCPPSLTENIPIRGRDGSIREQTWYYPSRENCLTCHNAHTSGVLGLKTRQLNRTFTYPSGVSDNELRPSIICTCLTAPVSDAQLATLPTLAACPIHSRSIEDRARSYLDANCGHCHRPGRHRGLFRCPLSAPRWTSRNSSTDPFSSTRESTGRMSFRRTTSGAPSPSCASTPTATSGCRRSRARPSTGRACSCCGTGSTACRARTCWARRRSRRTAALSRQR